LQYFDLIDRADAREGGGVEEAEYLDSRAAQFDHLMRVYPNGDETSYEGSGDQRLLARKLKEMERNRG
jgi:hypothetical protein